VEIQHRQKNTFAPDNLEVLVKAMEDASLCIFLSPKEYLQPPIPCPETLLLQLHVIWKYCFREDSTTIPLDPDITFSDQVPVFGSGRLYENKQEAVKSPNSDVGRSLHDTGTVSLASPVLINRDIIKKPLFPGEYHVAAHDDSWNHLSKRSSQLDSPVAGLGGGPIPATIVHFCTVEFPLSKQIVEGVKLDTKVFEVDGVWYHSVNFYVERTQECFMKLDTSFLTIPQDGIFSCTVDGVLEAIDDHFVEVSREMPEDNGTFTIIVTSPDKFVLETFCHEVRNLSRFLSQEV